MRVFRIVAIVVAILIVGTYALLMVAQRWQSPKLKRYATYTSQNIGAYLEQIKELEKVPLRAPSKQSRDAGKILNSRVRWRLPAKSSWNLPNEFPETLQGDFENAITGKGVRDTSVITLDMSWMRELTSKDYWDVEENSPIANLKCTTEPECSAMIGLDYRYVRNLARARIMKGIANKELPAAVAEAKSLALLLATTELSLSPLMARSILNDVDRASKTSFAQNNDWEKNAIVATELYLSPFSDDSARKQAIASFAGLNVCSEIGSSLQIARHFKPLLTPAWPLEKNFGEYFSDMEKLLESTKGKCRLKRVRQYWAHVTSPEDYHYIDRYPYGHPVRKTLAIIAASEILSSRHTDALMDNPAWQKK